MVHDYTPQVTVICGFVTVMGEFIKFQGDATDRLIMVELCMRTSECKGLW
jgi:hypothetical protein